MRVAAKMLGILLLSHWVSAEPPGISGRVLCGYQGWFACPGDGSGRGWAHWSRSADALAPGAATVDLWPDVAELEAGDRFSTGFTHPDGRPAQVFSSFRESTVFRHFAWMRAHGIDGVFVQRFGVNLLHPQLKRFNDGVLANCRAAARAHDRVLAVMYDLSGLKTGDYSRVVEDWRELRDLAEDSSYLRLRGRPLLAIWGVGFRERPEGGLAASRALVEALKAEGLAVMLGLPAYWRSGTRDAVSDPALLELCAMADVISPWTVGRYRDEPTLAAYAPILAEDVAWCRPRGIDVLPVVFPGFSWHNLRGGASDQIPRRGGRHLWSQFVSARTAGLDAAYVAMFDEVDEGTAIMPCVNDPPAQPRSRFIGFEGLPADHYLWLTGQGGRLLRGEIPSTSEPPPR